MKATKEHWAEKLPTRHGPLLPHQAQGGSTAAVHNNYKVTLGNRFAEVSRAKRHGGYQGWMRFCKETCETNR